MKDLDLTQLAILVYETLKQNGINAVLTGGSAVTVYTDNKYKSRDLDFISPDDHQKITAVMRTLGFKPDGKDFRHPETAFTVEFPTGPLSVGNEQLPDQAEITIRGKKLKILSPTNSIKDRLAGYYHWSDMQNLRQAIQLYKDVGGKLDEIERWSIAEGHDKKFQIFKKEIQK